MKIHTLPTLLMGLIASSLYIAIGYKGSALNVVNLTVSALLVMAAAAIALYKQLRQASQLDIRLPELIAALTIIWLFITIFWSQTPLLSFYTAWIISALPFGFLLRGWLKPWISDQQLLILLLSLISFYAFWATGEFLNTARSTHGPMIYQGDFGALFAAGLLPVNALFLLSPGKNGQTRYLLLTGLLGIALFSTYSRGSMLSYLMCLPVLLYLAHRAQQLTLNKTLRLGLSIAVAFLFIYFYAKWQGGQDMGAKTDLSDGTIPGLSSINARIMLYRSMLDMIRDYPILGSGIGSFTGLYPQYRNPAEDSAGYFGHNDYLQFLLEGGPILLLLWLFPLILIAKILLSKAKPQTNDTTSLLTASLALAAATFYIHAAADFIFYHLGLNLLAGLFLGLAYPQSPKPRPIFSMPLSEPRLLSILPTLCLCLGWSILAINSYITSNMEFQSDWFGTRDNQHIDAETILFYHQLSPNHTSPLIRLAELYHYQALHETNNPNQKASIEQAFNYTLQMLQQSPTYSRYYLKMAELVQNFPDYTTQIRQKMTPRLLPPSSEPLAKQLLKRALTLDPTSEAASIDLALYYQRHQQPVKALQVLKQATRWFNTPGVNALSPQDKSRQRLQRLIKKHIQTLGKGIANTSTTSRH